MLRDSVAHHTLTGHLAWSLHISQQTEGRLQRALSEMAQARPGRPGPQAAVGAGPAPTPRLPELVAA